MTPPAAPLSFASIYPYYWRGVTVYTVTNTYADLDEAALIGKGILIDGRPMQCLNISRFQHDYPISDGEIIGIEVVSTIS